MTEDQKHSQNFYLPQSFKNKVSALIYSLKAILDEKTDETQVDNPEDAEIVQIMHIIMRDFQSLLPEIEKYSNKLSLGARLTANSLIGGTAYSIRTNLDKLNLDTWIAPIKGRKSQQAALINAEFLDTIYKWKQFYPPEPGKNNFLIQIENFIPIYWHESNANLVRAYDEKLKNLIKKVAKIDTHFIAAMLATHNRLPFHERLEAENDLELALSVLNNLFEDISNLPEFFVECEGDSTQFHRKVKFIEDNTNSRKKIQAAINVDKFIDIIKSTEEIVKNITEDYLNAQSLKKLSDHFKNLVKQKFEIERLRENSCLKDEKSCYTERLHLYSQEILQKLNVLLKNIHARILKFFEKELEEIYSSSEYKQESSATNIHELDRYHLKEKSYIHQQQKRLTLTKENLKKSISVPDDKEKEFVDQLKEEQAYLNFTKHYQECAAIFSRLSNNSEEKFYSLRLEFIRKNSELIEKEINELTVKHNIITDNIEKLESKIEESKKNITDANKNKYELLKKIFPDHKHLPLHVNNDEKRASAINTRCHEIKEDLAIEFKKFEFYIQDIKDINARVIELNKIKQFFLNNDFSELKTDVNKTNQLFDDKNNGDEINNYIRRHHRTRGWSIRNWWFNSTLCELIDNQLAILNNKLSTQQDNFVLQCRVFRKAEYQFNEFPELIEKLTRCEYEIAYEDNNIQHIQNNLYGLENELFNLEMNLRSARIIDYANKLKKLDQYDLFAVEIKTVLTESLCKELIIEHHHKLTEFNSEIYPLLNEFKILSANKSFSKKYQQAIAEANSLRNNIYEAINISSKNKEKLLTLIEEIASYSEKLTEKKPIKNIIQLSDANKADDLKSFYDRNPFDHWLKSLEKIDSFKEVKDFVSKKIYDLQIIYLQNKTDLTIMLESNKQVIAFLREGAGFFGNSTSVQFKIFNNYNLTEIHELKAINFYYCSFAQITWPPIVKCNFSKCDLTKANFKGVDLSESTFEGEMIVKDIEFNEQTRMPLSLKKKILFHYLTDLSCAEFQDKVNSVLTENLINVEFILDVMSNLNRQYEDSLDKARILPPLKSRATEIIKILTPQLSNDDKNLLRQLLNKDNFIRKHQRWTSAYGNTSTWKVISRKLEHPRQSLCQSLNNFFRPTRRQQISTPKNRSLQDARFTPV